MNRRIAAVACAAALTSIAAGTASAAPAPAPASASASVGVMAPPVPGRTYVVAPQDTPDQWLGDNDWFGSVVCQASRLWSGDRRDDALWRVTGNNDGSISLVNMDAAQNGWSLASSGEGIRIAEGNGEEFHWDVVAGPGGTVALQNRQTRRFLSIVAGTVVGAAQAYYWYMTNARP
ncbi:MULTISPECIES: hypothetical protein [unclassified Streptomyces]|uniref:hypothetical protein n=1 Tax=unclassified Streptomyces TaxID=2593676 RepID=UPI00214C1ADD|nr:MULTISPECIES: hypothetical protein [unclassified Streptomyces]MCX5013282.1 hypothetical protein [Streptomyces sp. NBC_00555]UUU41440.1 hypothetical protein JIW86_23020 [Streptomyces sp. NBC_00162]